MAHSERQARELEEGGDTTRATTYLHETEGLSPVREGIPEATIVGNVTEDRETTLWVEQVEAERTIQPQPRAFGEEQREPASCSLCKIEISRNAWLVFLWVALAVAGVFSLASEFGSSDQSARRSPIPYPTIETSTLLPTNAPVAIPPAVVDACPAEFEHGQNTTLSSCINSGCGGSIRWCGLNATSLYRLIVHVRGDYDLLDEFVTLTFDGNGVQGSAGEQCGGTFVEIANQLVNSTSGGELLLHYQNSASVTAICNNVFATELRATLLAQ